jgi:HAD superfamily hydrolase (TIGR01509 family)
MKAFLFDFDGVIVDSERYWDKLLEERLPVLVPNWDSAVLKRMMGQSAQGVVKLLEQEFGVHITVEQYLAFIDEAVMKVYEETCVLMPGFLDLTKRLQAAGIPLSIVSSSQRKWVEAAVKRFGLSPLFPIIVAGDDLPGRAKPLPDLYLRGAELMGIDPKECVAIEDSRNGIVSAKAAGMRCIALSTELNQSQDLSAADIRVTHMDQVEVGAL